MFTFATDYFLLVFVASIGVIQIAASLGRLNGLLIVQRPLLVRGLGLVLVVAPFVWFFTTGERNINDHEGGLDAPTQALFFFLGTLAGGFVTFLASSLINAGMQGGTPSPEAGLDALKQTNFARALTNSLRYWCREWRTQTKQYFFG